MAGSGPLLSFGTILSSVAKQLGLETRLVEVRIQQQWPDLVGEPIGSHTWPVQIRFHKLYLLVENSVWLQQLTFLKPALLAKLNAEAGSELLTDIVLRVGEIPTQKPEPAPAIPADALRRAPISLTVFESATPSFCKAELTACRSIRML